MIKPRIAILLAFMAFFSTSYAADELAAVAIVGGTLIDGTGAAPVMDAVILVKGDRVTAVGTSSTIEIPEGAEVINVAGKWILPGFVDLHTHLATPVNERQIITHTNSIATLRALHFMDRLLRAGVTSVRNLGSSTEAMAAIQEASRLGYVSSLRLFASGSLITSTGGHGDGPYNHVSGALIVDGAEGFRKAVRQMHRLGFGYIKISPYFTPEEVSAAVDEAHIRGMQITSHAGGVSDTDPPTMTKIAVEGGVDSIEHPPKMSDGTLELMAKKGTHWVPTIAIYLRLDRELGFPSPLPERGWTAAMCEDLFRRGKALGITMGIGSDYSAPWMDEYPEPYFSEMNAFVALGYSPMETIVAATRNGGIILGKEDRLGTLEVGKWADLQVIDGNPLESFDALGHPEIVMVGGKVHRF